MRISDNFTGLAAPSGNILNIPISKCRLQEETSTQVQTRTYLEFFLLIKSSFSWPLRPWGKTSCDNYFCSTRNGENPGAGYHMPQPSNTTFKGQAFLQSQNAGLIFLTYGCTSKYLQDLQEHNSQLQLSEVIPMLC